MAAAAAAHTRPCGLCLAPAPLRSGAKACPACKERYGRDALRLTSLFHRQRGPDGGGCELPPRSRGKSVLHALETGAPFDVLASPEITEACVRLTNACTAFLAQGGPSEFFHGKLEKFAPLDDLTAELTEGKADGTSETVMRELRRLARALRDAVGEFAVRMLPMRGRGCGPVVRGLTFIRDLPDRTRRQSPHSDGEVNNAVHVLVYPPGTRAAAFDTAQHRPVRFRPGAVPSDVPADERRAMYEAFDATPEQLERRMEQDEVKHEERAVMRFFSSRAIHAGGCNPGREPRTGFYMEICYDTSLAPPEFVQLHAFDAVAALYGLWHPLAVLARVAHHEHLVHDLQHPDEPMDTVYGHVRWRPPVKEPEPLYLHTGDVPGNRAWVMAWQRRLVASDMARIHAILRDAGEEVAEAGGRLLHPLAVDRLWHALLLVG